jgi:hypothetical protein
MAFGRPKSQNSHFYTTLVSSPSRIAPTDSAEEARFYPIFLTLLALLVLTFGTISLLGIEAYRDYVNVVLPKLGKFQGFGYNLSLAGFWHKLFDPSAEIRLTPSIYPSLALARWATLTSDLCVTLIAILMVHYAKTEAQRDLAFGAVITAMLLVSPVTWDITLLLLFLPIAFIAHHANHAQRLLEILTVIIGVIFLPQPFRNGT